MKDTIIKAIQQRINAASVNGKEDIASAMRELLEFVLPLECQEESYRELYTKHAEMKVKIAKLYLEV